jgi:hypothetical protein
MSVQVVPVVLAVELDKIQLMHQEHPHKVLPEQVVSLPQLVHQLAVVEVQALLALKASLNVHHKLRGAETVEVEFQAQSPEHRLVTPVVVAAVQITTTFLQLHVAGAVEAKTIFSVLVMVPILTRESVVTHEQTLDLVEVVAITKVAVA